MGLVGDCGHVLDQLLPMVEKRDHGDWVTKLRNAYAAFMTTELEQRETPSDPIHPNRLVAKIMEVFGKDAFYVADGGDTSYYGLAGFSVRPSGRGPDSGRRACWGAWAPGSPLPLRPNLPIPDKPVVVLNGDGSFGFNSMEFDTAVRHNIPIICVVNNDCAWGMIKHSQEMSLGKDRMHLRGTGHAAL